MSDSIAGSYMTLGGVEIVNDARTISYLKKGLAPPSLTIFGEGCACPDLITFIGCDDEYTNPAEDNAPWYSADVPESANFAGFLMTEFEGMDSTFTRPTSERILNGSIFGRSRLAGRQMTWTGLLLGSSCCAVSYGLRWLAKQLSSSGSCNDCSGTDLELLFCCPSLEEVDEGVEPFRLLKNVALVTGPRITDQRGSGCGCGASCIVEVEFTLLAAQPFFYSAPIPVYDCVDLVTNSIPSLVGLEAISCDTDDCGSGFLDFVCPPPALPPASEYNNTCFFTSTGLLRSLYLSVPRSAWGSLEEVVPVISITTGSVYLYQPWIRFYYSSSGDPCGEMFNNIPVCDTACDTLRIMGVPENTTFYIDGRTRKMSLICNSVNVSPGERLINGPWSWPSFNCDGFCMEVLYYADPTDPVVSDVCVSLSLVPRTF